MRQMYGYAPGCRTSRESAATWPPLAALGVLVVIATFAFASTAQGAPGDLDPSFGTGGVATTDIGNIDFINDMALQVDGRIVVVGSSESEDFDSQFIVARYNSDGSLDTTFAEDGIAETSISFSVAEGVAIQDDGKIVVAGNTFDGEDFAVVRYNSDGSLDTTFAGDGIQTTSFGLSDAAYDVVLQSDGKIVVAGSTYDGLGDFAVARYNADGSLDTSFGGDGKVTTDIVEVDNGLAVTAQVDGKIVVAGSSGGTVSVVRYLSDGSVDPSFTLDAIDWGPGFHTAQDVTIQDDGKIVIAGGEGDFIFARYNPDGSVDPTFAGTGAQSVDFGGTLDSAYAVGIQANGYVVATGSTNAGGGFADMATTRLDASGAIDTTFGGDGKVTFGASEDGDHASSLAIQADGKILVAGDSNNGDFTLARYEYDGPPAAQHTLAVNVAGAGSLVSSPAGIDCGAVCTGAFAEGETVRLTATADSGWFLLGWSWSGSGPGCVFDETTTNTCDVTLTADAEITAEFKDSSEGEQPQDESDDDESASSSGASPAAVPPPALVPIASAPRGVGVARNVALVKGPIALLPLRCVGQNPCRGVAKLFVRLSRGKGKGRANRKGARRSAARKRGKRLLVIGKGRFAVAPGKRGKVRIRLTRAGKRLVMKAGRRGLRARLVGSGLRKRGVKLRQRGRRNAKRQGRRRRELAQDSSLRRDCVNAGKAGPRVVESILRGPGDKKTQTAFFKADWPAMPKSCSGSFRRAIKVRFEIQNPFNLKRWVRMSGWRTPLRDSRELERRERECEERLEREEGAPDRSRGVRAGSGASTCDVSSVLTNDGGRALAYSMGTHAKKSPYHIVKKHQYRCAPGKAVTRVRALVRNRIISARTRRVAAQAIKRVGVQVVRSSRLLPRTVRRGRVHGPC